jgi:hypothetical protein
MQKKGNNPAQNKFTDRELDLDLIDEITLTMADINHLITYHNINCDTFDCNIIQRKIEMEL